MNQIPPNLINAGLFQVTWFAAVLGAADAIGWWAYAALGLLAAHVLSMGRWRRELIVAGMCVLVGGLLDTLWIQLGILDFGTPVAPGWIVVLWASVGLSINYSLSWFLERPLLGGVFAACAAPLSYSAGAGFDAAVILAPIGLAAISATWLVLFWALFLVNGAYLNRANRDPQLEFKT